MKSGSLNSDNARKQRTAFRRGLRCFEVDDLEGALTFFSRADRDADADDAMADVYASYHGLALVYLGDDRGLELCRGAAAGKDIHADVLRNLADAEFRHGHRRHAHLALGRGLQLDARHRGLLRLRTVMEQRRRPAIPFLSRDHALNRWIGRVTYRFGSRPLQAVA